MLVLVCILLSVLVVVLGYTTFNLLRKNEKQEDILRGYMTYLNKFSEIIDYSHKKLKEVDSKGSFESDDEVGFFFQQLKALQEILDTFNVKNL
jgi:hypothetical protein